jgi:alkaline phosphatase D
MLGGLAGGAFPNTGSVKIFVRVASPASVRVDYSTNQFLFTYQSSAWKIANAGNDYTAIVPVTGLAAATRYYYKVVINCIPQHVIDQYPYFTTPPLDGTAEGKFAFAFTADNLNVEDNPTASSPIYQTIHDLTTDFDPNNDPKIFFQIGDWDHRNPGQPGGNNNANCGQTGQPVCDTQWWRDLHRDVRGPSRLGVNTIGSEFEEYIESTFPVEHIWDNHDMAGLDYLTRPNPLDQIADEGFEGRPNALQAFLEYVPMHDLPNPPSCAPGNFCTGGLWRKFTYANVDFFVLDLRTQRINTPEPGASMLGSDQYNWFTTQLKSSQDLAPSRWRVIITALPFNALAKQTAGSWGYFQTQRRNIVEYINNNNIKNVLFVSGDLHSGGAIDYGQTFGLVAGYPEISVPHTNISGSTRSSGMTLDVHRSVTGRFPQHPPTTTTSAEPRRQA